jgi:vacuolar protein sorting-associated protein 53
MLLDTANLTASLLNLPILTSPEGTAIPSTFTKRAQTTLSRPQPLLKTLQVRPSPPESLVQAYLIHISDKSDTNFRKVLELKGLAKKDQAQLLELFSMHRASPRHNDLPAQNPLLTSLVVPGSSSGVPTVGVSTATTALGAANLQARFDASALGNALMTAARDGVGRLQDSPSMSGVGSRAVSPPPSVGPSAMGLVAMGSEGTSNVNQNLRNIGKFFRRDLSNLGNRFGKGSEDGR